MTPAANRRTCVLSIGVAAVLVLLSQAAELSAKPAQAPTPPAGSPAAPSSPAPTPAPAKAPHRPPPAAVANPAFGIFGDPLPMIRRSVLQDVPGRLDHMAMDRYRNQLLVCCPAKGTLEVLDLTTDKQPQSLQLPEPQGIIAVPESSASRNLSAETRFAVGCGDGSVRMLARGDDDLLKVERTIKYSGEADVVRYDASRRRVWVGHGKSIGWFNPDTGEKGPSVELPGKPEAFVMMPAPDPSEGSAAPKPKLLANVPSRGEIAVIDIDSGKVDAAWPLPDGAKGNYAMAVGRAGEGAAFDRLFVVARSPAKLFVVNVADGKAVQTLDSPGDADDVWFDAKLRKVYVSGGGDGGKLRVYKTQPDGTLAVEHTATTSAGARTSVLIPEQRRLIVAAPTVGIDPTFIYVYLIGP